MTPRPRSPFGWDEPARGLLAIVAAASAVALTCSAGSDPGPAGPSPDLVVDPNTAPTEVLLTLPRLGPALVGRIVEARRDRPFSSCEDLDARVRGIGPATIEALRPHLRFESGHGAESP